MHWVRRQTCTTKFVKSKRNNDVEALNEGTFIMNVGFFVLVCATYVYERATVVVHYEYTMYAERTD